MNYKTQAKVLLLLWITLWLILLFVEENFAAFTLGFGSLIAFLFNHLMDQSYKEEER